MITNVFGGTQPYYFSLDGQSFSTNPTFDHLKAGDYHLDVRDASGCIQSLSIKVPEPAEMEVRMLASDSTVVSGVHFTLQAIYAPETLAIQSIRWEPSELFQKQDTLRQQVSILKSTKFGLEITDKNGCTAHNGLTITVKEPNVYTPNVLKIGSENDAYFTVFAGEGVEKISALKIYNRAGIPLFDQTNFAPNDPSKGWNGKWNGKNVSPGVYVWVASIHYQDGSNEILEGTVTVLE